MTFYHVNQTTVRSGLCYSARGECPLPEDLHFTSAEAAQYYLLREEEITDELSADDLLEEIAPFVGVGLLSDIFEKDLMEEEIEEKQDLAALAFLVRTLKFEEDSSSCLTSSEGLKLLKELGSYEKLIGKRSFASYISYEMVEVKRRLVKNAR